MVRFAIGGHLEKLRIAEILKETGGSEVAVEIMSDMGAAQAVKNGKADYYLGACNTGGGGAIAMAIAFLSIQACETISRSGKPSSYEDITALVKAGKKAFGMTSEHVNILVPLIVKAILNNK